MVSLAHIGTPVSLFQVFERNPGIKFGVHIAGATVQIILFATIAIELKRRAPNAHTFLEVVRARYGPVTHGYIPQPSVCL